MEGSDSPIGRLGGLARQMDPTSKDVTERFARNREALASVQHELSALAGAARNSVRWNTLDIVMVVEIVLFVLFVVYQVTRKRQKQSLL